ncbi:hypothetical protein [Helicobacter canis]|uniref:hypothetical protein n=1 Tax=Helicobacter canis TaxID=29419 RepID=UPI0026F22EBA|nr:hypothetical protein [Helicobacter canis]
MKTSTHNTASHKRGGNLVDSSSKLTQVNITHNDRKPTRLSLSLACFFALSGIAAASTPPYQKMTQIILLKASINKPVAIAQVVTTTTATTLFGNLTTGKAL